MSFLPPPLFSFNRKVSLLGWKVPILSALRSFSSHFSLECEKEESLFDLAEEELKFQLVITPNGSFVFFLDKEEPFVYFGVDKNYLLTEKKFGENKKIQDLLLKMDLLSVPPTFHTFVNI